MSIPGSAATAARMVDAHWDGPGLHAWRGAWTPWEAAEKLAGLGVPWCVVGGWAIDLFLGRRTRPHGDLEIAIVRPDLPAVRARLAQYRFHAVGDGEVRALAPGEAPPDDRHQTWVLDEAEQLWRVDVMQEPGDHATWVCRRDESIAEPRARMIAARDGIPYLRREGVLLYKAKARRPKDEADFAACGRYLPPDARAWLGGALARVHPGHAWIAKLDQLPPTPTSAGMGGGRGGAGERSEGIQPEPSSPNRLP